MPSPLAHGSLALLAWPALRGRAPAPVPRWRRAALLVLLLMALGAPDLDILLDPLLGRPWFATHGGPAHSLAAGLVFAFIFAAAARAIVSISLPRLWTVGLLAYWSHVLLDACTYGRGVMLLWPLTSERFGTPVPLFFGVRHGDWGNWPLHLITLGTEAVFAGAVWFLTARLRRRATGAHAPAPRPGPSPRALLEGALR